MRSSSNPKGKTFLTYIVLLFICLAAMNVINRYYYFMFIAFGLFCVKPFRKFHLDIFPIFSLLLLAVSWLAFSPGSTATIIGILKPFTYLFCYVVGSGLLDDDNTCLEEITSYRLFYVTVASISFGALMHYLLNWIANRNSFESRNTIDFWAGSEMSATGQAALACLPLALAIACIFVKNNWKIKITALATIIFILNYNFILAGRTLLLMLLIISLIAFLHFFVKEKKSKLYILLVFVAIIVLLVFIYQSNAFGLKTFFEKTPFYDRFFAEESSAELDDDVRMERKRIHLERMHENLFGGAHIREENGYAHDIFLDTYDEAGIFAFIAIICYMFNTLSRFIKCITDDTLPFAFRQIVLCVYIAVYIEFMIEPILQGMPWLFAIFCLIDGYVHRVLLNEKAIAYKQNKNTSAGITNENC